MTPNAPWAAFGVRSVVAWRKTVTLNEEKSEVHPRRKDMTSYAKWVAFGVRSLECGASLPVATDAMSFMSSFLCRVEQKAPRSVSWRHEGFLVAFSRIHICMFTRLFMGIS